MFGWLEDIGLLNQIFLYCAVGGGVAFIGKMSLMLFGADAEVDADGGFDGDAHFDSDASFQFVSVQGIIGFVMMFGLIGLFLHLGLNVNGAISIMGALLAGLATLYATAKMMSFMKGLQSSGNIDYKQAIGKDGTVYLTIPPGGVGKVNVNINDRIIEYNAVSNSNDEIKTGEQVTVVFMKGDNLIVEKI